MYSIIFRTLIFYFIISSVKKKDLNVYLSIIWGYATIKYETPLFNYILITTLIIFFEFVKNYFIKDNETSDVVILNGKINFKVLDRLNYSINSLINELKLKGVESINDVSLAILSKNKINLLKIKDKDPVPIIIDGEISYNSLDLINKDKDWVISLLKEKKLSAKDILYAFYKNDKCFIIKN